MTELAPGTSWNAWRIDSVLGRGPSAVVYRAVRTADGRPASLKIFNEDVDEPALRRIEDDTRRLIGLGHPNILRVDAVGREGSRLHVACELFEGRSLRMAGSRPRAEVGALLLKAARALGAAWMRLILHRNLKPENILTSASGDLKVCDFGQFRDATSWWAPERRGNNSPDLRGDLYSLGAVFKELIPAGDADLDGLIQKMTQTETFERVQMVEDVLSRLESWQAKNSSTAAPVVAPPPPPVIPEYKGPSFPPAPSWVQPDPALTAARGTLVNTLSAISRTAARIPAPPSPKMERPVFLPPPPPRMEIPVTQAPTPPPPRPKPVEPTFVPKPPPPMQQPARPVALKKSGGGFRGFIILASIAAFIGYQSWQRSVVRHKVEQVEQLNAAGKADEARRMIEQRIRAEKASQQEKDLLEKVKFTQWRQEKARILKLDADGDPAAALKACEQFIAKNAESVPPDAAELRKSLNTWVSAVKQAEQSWKYGGDKRALEVLQKAGPEREKDVQRMLAKWCDEDWARLKDYVEKAAAQDNAYAANLEIDRFLRKAHLGGSHKQDAEALQRRTQADIDYPSLTDRVDTLKSRSPADAAAAIEAFLAKPHQGGTHREELEKQLAQLKDDAKQILFSGRTSISRLGVNAEARRIAFTSDGIHVLDLDPAKELWTIPQRSLLRGLSVAATGNLVMVGNSGKVSIWDIEAKSELRAWSPASGYIVGSVMPDGKTVYSAISDGSFVTWDSTKDDAPKVEKDAAPGVIAMALSADRKRVAFASRDKSLRVRELAGGREWKWQGPPVAVAVIALDPEGKLLFAASTSGMLTIWNVETGEAGPALTGHKGPVSSVDVSAQGQILASAGSDGDIRLSSAKDGSTIRVLSGHRSRVTAVAFLGSSLISAGSDGTIRTWPLKELQR